MNYYEITKRQCDATLKIVESIAHSMEQDKECRKIIAKEYIAHINRLAAERDILLREVERLTEMLSYMQNIIASSIKPGNTINVK